MFCYRDMTFCEARDCKHFGPACHRSLTDEVKKKANEWWSRVVCEGEPALICTFTEPPKVCYDPVADDNLSSD